VEVKNNVQEAVKEAMELIGWRNFISPQAEVSLKLNLGWDLFLPGAVSAPWVVEGVIQTIKDYVSQIYLVESDQVLVNCEKALRQTHLSFLTEKYKISFINMSKGKFVEVKNPRHFVLKKVLLPEILTRTEIITLPVMKTHGRTTITGAIKNQWGCLNKLRHQYHLQVDQALVDINKLVRPKLAVMDGTVGLEGNGPKSGIPKIANLVLASADLVALDTVASQIMGFKPEKIKHLQLCAREKLGCANLKQIKIVKKYKKLPSLKFKPGKNNAIAKLEILFRRSSFFKKVIFQTPLFSFCCWLAKVWYFLWYYVLLKGIRQKNKVLRHPFYGKQWRKK
jgi:uncharacterized protein (DUF362 family)